MDIGIDLKNAYNDGYFDGINKAISIIEEELELAKSVNPQMAMEGL